MLPPVLARLPMLDVVRCYFEPGRLVPEPRAEPAAAGEPRVHHRARRASEGADFGVAYDGDADRCFFVDDTGEFVPGDFTTALFAETILAREPGGKVIYDVRASWAVPETIERAGGVPLINRVGHAFIKQRMREVDAVFAGEVSAHYYFRDFSQADSGTVPFLLMCELVSRRGKLSEVLAPFRAQVLHHRRDQHAGRRRAGEAAGAGGALRRGGPGHAPRRPLGRLRRLALQRAPVEHGAAAPPEPRSALAGADGREARRGARRHPRRADAVVEAVSDAERASSNRARFADQSRWSDQVFPKCRRTFHRRSVTIDRG